MSLLYAIENKLVRYYNLLSRVRNWPAYLFRKATGFSEVFHFSLRDFQDLAVPRDVLGTFRECYLDQIYLRFIPHQALARTPDPVIVDIGGHVGYFAMSIIARYSTATVYSLEPHPYNYRALQSKTALFGQDKFSAHQLAVSDRSGPLELYTQTLDRFTTKSTVMAEPGKQSFMVDAVRLDTFLNDQQIGNVDFLKVDCEGAEYAILYSLPAEVFKRIGAMCIETHESELSDEKSVALAAYLQKMGYHLKRRKLNATGYIWAWRE